MFENIRSTVSTAASFVWNNKGSIGVTTGAVAVTTSLTAWGVRAVVLESASPAVATVVGVGAFVVTAIPYAYTRFARLSNFFSGNYSPAADNIHFQDLDIPEKIVSAGVVGVGTVTMGLTIIAVDKSFASMLSNIFNWDSSNLLGVSFGVSPLTLCFTAGVLAYGYNFFVKNAIALSEVITSWGTFKEKAGVVFGTASLVYMVTALGLTQPLYEFLLENFSASIAMSVLAAGADAITYMGQLGDHREILEKAYADPASRSTFWTKNAIIGGSVVFNAMANYGTLKEPTNNITVLRVAGAGIAALVQNGLFNIPFHQRLSQQSRDKVVDEESSLISDSDNTTGENTTGLGSSR
ncbi:MAG TPA: hypothetical protein VGV92_01280 [Gammaproteobacteria bacterium]|nr:hypothetical protein [Gammaproteobacteria bacterium]